MDQCPCRLSVTVESITSGEGVRNGFFSGMGFSIFYACCDVIFLMKIK